MEEIDAAGDGHFGTCGADDSGPADVEDLHGYDFCILRNSHATPPEIVVLPARRLSTTAVWRFAARIGSDVLESIAPGASAVARSSTAGRDALDRSWCDTGDRTEREKPVEPSANLKGTLPGENDFDDDDGLARDEYS